MQNICIFFRLITNAMIINRMDRTINLHLISICKYYPCKSPWLNLAHVPGEVSWYHSYPAGCKIDGRMYEDNKIFGRQRFCVQI